ncbi:unnamed protein product, partial [Chrysoparadoxa australica]
SLAYDIAKNKDSWEVYKEDMDKYPDSYYFKEADSHYHRLIFLDKTLDNKLNSFIRFLRDFPDTPHRAEIEWVILSRSVIDHQWDSYVSFLRDYPNSYLSKRVIDMLYYITKANDYVQYPDLLNLTNNQDSLNQAKTIEHHLLLPTFTEGKYGFITTKGEVILDNQYSEIKESYLCGGIDSELLMVSPSNQHQIVRRNGNLL